MAFAVAMIAGFYGSLVGASSLLIVPTLIFLGFPTQIAIATFRFGNLGQPISSIYEYNRKKLVDYRIGLPIAIVAFGGAIIGANLVLRTDNLVLKKIVGVITIAILLFIVSVNKIGIEKREKEMEGIEWVAGLILSFFLGIYGGFYGSGVVTFFSYLLLILFGQDFLECAGTSKLPNLSISLIAAFIFIINEKVDYQFGGTIFIGMLMGAYLGVHYSTKLGNVWMKRLFFVVVLIMGLGLLL